MSTWFKSLMSSPLLAIPVLAYSATPTCQSTDFDCAENAPINSVQTSKTEPVTVGLLGLGSSRITVDHGSYQINSGTYTPDPGYIQNKDDLTLRLAAAATPGTETTMTVSLGNNAYRVFRVITAASVTPSFIRWSNYGKLTLPVDQDKKDGADEIPASRLGSYSSRYFYGTSAGQKTAGGYTAANGETVFWAPVNGGGTTSNADYVRSEMREQISLGKDTVNWPLKGTHIQTGTVRVTLLPKPKKAGEPTKTVVAQIHGLEVTPPVKLQFSNSAFGTVVYGIYNAKPDGSSDESSTKRVSIRLGESFTYEIKVINGVLTTKVNDQLIDSRNLNQNWAGQTFYFKAGNYVQNDTDTASGAAEVVYSALRVTHN